MPQAQGSCFTLWLDSHLPRSDWMVHTCHHLLANASGSDRNLTMLSARPSASIVRQCASRGRTTSVKVLARGPVVTKKGVAFKKMPEPESEPPSEDIGTVGMALIALGLPANPICLWSEFTLATTGSGLPEGPGGALGAAEGISYLVIVGVVVYSLYTKVSTGRGLPAGPSGLLGAVEGLSYLSVLGGLVAFAVSVGLRS